MVQLVCCVVASTANDVVPAMRSDGGPQTSMRLHGWRTACKHGRSSGEQRMDADCPATSWARRGQGFDGVCVALLRVRACLLDARRSLLLVSVFIEGKGGRAERRRGGEETAAMNSIDGHQQREVTAALKLH